MPLVQTRGAASAQGFGEFAQSGAVNYIEDVFSTYLYTSTGFDITVTNGIDLSTKGGLVWIKSRSNAFDHYLTDTVRGAGRVLYSDLVNGQSGPGGGGASSFSTTGYVDGNQNASPITQVSWTFREQAKFFDVVTYTGTGSNTTIAHSLGAVPGSIIVKRTDTTAAWAVYHRSLANTQYLVLNTTAAVATGATRWNSTTATSAVFSLGTDATVNASGGTYVAYLFAHDAGGFGLAGTDNVISCGTYTGVGSTQQDITLGYEPQWVMIKRTDTTDSWMLVDNMRGFFQTADNALEANSSNAEATGVSVSGAMQPIATGFHLYNANSAVNASGGTYIYIACRRGPMKVPTLGTSVFSPVARAGTGATGSSTSFGQVTDLTVIKQRSSTQTWAWTDRLRGATQELTSAATTVETAFANDVTGFNTMTGFTFGTGASGQVNTSAATYSDLLFKRAPGFFDEVCYTGTGVRPLQLSHNLGAVPELMIVKIRATAAQPWFVYSSALGNTQYLSLNTTAAFATSISAWSNTTPTSTTFTVGDFDAVNGSTNYTYVAYLFATCAGVSKVGSYTGTATTLQIDCGFTAGARFVLIKRTDSTGDWYVWDSARGIVAGNDPYLLLNSTAAEVTNTDYVDTYSAGFEISSTAPAAINASAGTFVFLAIA